jgi:hypothetical protein
MIENLPSGECTDHLMGECTDHLMCEFVALILLDLGVSSSLNVDSDDLVACMSA